MRNLNRRGGLWGTDPGVMVFWGCGLMGLQRCVGGWGGGGGGRVCGVIVTGYGVMRFRVWGLWPFTVQGLRRHDCCWSGLCQVL